MNKIALVTGSVKGIGKAIALQLASDGFDIIVHYRNSKSDALETVKDIQKIGHKAYLVQGDITKEDEIEKIFIDINKITNKLDLLVNNAGYDYGYMIEDYSMKQMKEIVDLILVARMSVTKHSLNLLKQSSYPTIINIASRMGGPTTIETIGAYGPAEAGVIKFTQCCALEFSKYNIRVNCVAPGLTDTGLTRSIYPEESFWKSKAESNPRHRVGKPQDIANVVSFLASEKSDYINGAMILVTGGSELH